MGRGLERKKKRQKAKEEARLKAQRHHESKRRRVEPPVAVKPAASHQISKPAAPAAALKPASAKAPLKKARVIDPTTAAALAREEEELKMLEKKLGLKGKRSLPKAFDEDGLSYLLGWQDDVEELRNASGGLIDDSDASGEEGFLEEREGDEVEEDEGAELGGPASEQDAEEGGDVKEEEKEAEDDEAEEEGIDGKEEGEGEYDDDEASDGAESQPFNATRSSAAKKYVPPALRHAPSDTEAIVQRRIRSALNKLSPSNLNGITQELEGVFSSAPRVEVISALVQGLVTNAAGAFGRAQIAARAALLAALGGSVGGDVLGSVLSAAVQRLDSLLSSPASLSSFTADTGLPSAESLSASALLSLLSALLGLGAISARILFDFANRLTASFSEHTVDLLYQLFQHSGFALRDADVTELRTLIATVQGKAAALKGIGEGRLKYLLESLTNLKHNKRSLQADDALESLKKWLRTRTRKCEVQEGGWQDWLEGSVAKKWVSGAAVKERAEDEEGESAPAAASEDAVLEALARKERINTPGRRAVFCLLMGAEDYADAVEKLSRIGVQGRAERDVGAILLHCASREAQFNPFYAHVAARLCGLRHSYKVTFQFAFWDKIKEADSLRLPELANLAKLLAQLSGQFALSLSVLRIIEFEPLLPRHLLFLRICFIHLFTSFPEATILSALRRLCAAPNTADLREGLLGFVEKGISAPRLSAENALKVKRGARMARKVLEEAEQVDMGEPEETENESD